jgi:hypothetical protein
MTKKKAFREPETRLGYTHGLASRFVFGKPMGESKKPVRIIHEKDYQRLLKAAREKKS